VEPGITRAVPGPQLAVQVTGTDGGQLVERAGQDVQ
jgi:hypothetical protein